MLAFIIRRLLSLIPLLLAVTLLASILMSLSPGDPYDALAMQEDVSDELVQQLRQEAGLVDDEGNPTAWYERYFSWLGNAVTGDFGMSNIYRVPVFELLLQRVPATLILSLTSTLFAWCIAVPLGVLAAIYKDSIWDRLSAILAYAALSIPEFFLAILAVFFAAVTGILPVGGKTSTGSEFASTPVYVADYLYHLILPTIVLGIGGVAGMMRIMRANFIDYMRQEFVTTARAKGLRERVVMFKHVLRNAINPLLSAAGFAFAALLSGALLVENVMNYPGLGQLVFEAITTKDEYVVMAALMVSTIMLVLGNLLADVALAWSDPRIRVEGGGEARSNPIRTVTASLLLVVALIAGVIYIQEHFPKVEALLKEMLLYGGIYIVAVLALICFALVFFMISVLVKRLGRQVLQRRLGVVCLTILGVMYGLMLAADFVAPYSATNQNLAKNLHPPTKIFWEDGGLRVQEYERTDFISEAGSEATKLYRPVEGASHKLEFLPLIPEEETYRVPLISPLLDATLGNNSGDLRTKLFGLETNDPQARVYLLGSDQFGRDVFSRLLYGSRVSLTIGIIGISITLTLGFIVGGLAGYLGGTFDFFGMRLVELLMSIPGLYLLLALRSALFEPGFSSTQVFFAIVVILAIIGWAGAARIIRGMTLSIRSRQFVLAAESMGQPTSKILLQHILPNLASYLLVAATLSIPGYILMEAALSFLGLGITEPNASWGLMLRQSQTDMSVFFLGHWWLLMPGVMIFVTVLIFNVFGDVLRDVVDPRMQGR